MNTDFSFDGYILNLIDQAFIEILIKYRLSESYRISKNRSRDSVTLIEYENDSYKLIFRFDRQGFNIICLLEYRDSDAYFKAVKENLLCANEAKIINILDVINKNNVNYNSVFDDYSSNQLYTEIFRKQIECIAAYLLNSELLTSVTNNGVW